ncbi:MAG: HAD family phosphatase [Bacteroidales bacterium]|nr:HAD family phosphatase [Bacteroidales bacterium]MDD3201532.1 HAD family phosphatase [Bacteroidales bacterium]
MIRNIIFDFGGVLIKWNPRFLYRDYFNDDGKMEYFLSNICTNEWNGETDRGRPFAESIRMLQEQYPEYHDDIQLYMDGWTKMIGGPVPGTADILLQLKEKGYHTFGLTNWSIETFPYAQEHFPILNELEGIVVSGKEKMIKPEPGLYNVLLNRYGLIPQESIFIDDNQVNIDGAVRLGINGLLFTTAQELREALTSMHLL